MTKVLGIETSCDETGVAIVEDGTRILSNQLASQIDIHAEFGGVVPEIASREHTKIIATLARKALDEAGPVDVIAATNGPGLMGSLLVGVSFAKALAFAQKLPFVPVHHIEGHLFSVTLETEDAPFPCLALIVSGGHTQLIDCPEPHTYTILGTTRDDAVGEAFDKVARLLHLPYPGGPSIQKAAANGNPKAFDFPRAFKNTDSLEFSYSGLKTAVLYTLRDNPDASQHDIAASFQEAAIDALVMKTKQALKQTQARRLIVAGGVAANALLRKRLESEISVPVLFPALSLCADNAAMIAAVGYSRWKSGHLGDFHTTPRSNLPLVPT